MSIFWVLCVVRLWPLRRTDRWSRGVLPIVGCPKRVIAKPRKRRPWPGIGSWRHKKNEFLWTGTVLLIEIETI
jgi:hypothetical protein